MSTLTELLELEVVQCREEGRDIASLEERIFGAMESCEPERIETIYDELVQAPIRPGFPFKEPSDLGSILALRPKNELLLRGINTPARWSDPDTPAQWSDKFLGAWLGRCCGCALGKPLEMAPFTTGENGKPGWRFVHEWFEATGDYPICGYTPGPSEASRSKGLSVLLNTESLRENIRFMETDDDLRFTVLGLILLERKGLDWSSRDIGELWHELLSYGQVYTAEKRAYLNYAQATFDAWGSPSAEPAWWTDRMERVRMYRNPCREWIGAQIRVDAYAYASAGNPELAAELAWRDASFSHVKNGIYGAMFVAAMIAAAFVEPDAEKLVQIGLSAIPSTCRLARDIEVATELAQDSRSQLELVERLWKAFGQYHPVHTNNNAALVAAALVFAGDDFEKAITTAVLGGWDTDCNGATVGSIMGAMLGAASIPPRWKEPLNDTLYTGIPGFHPVAISDLARRSEAVHGGSMPALLMRPFLPLPMPGQAGAG
jgi:ADP-ribosylglycohydrolase